jgi:hypothetical protein
MTGEWRNGNDLKKTAESYEKLDDGRLLADA